MKTNKNSQEAAIKQEIMEAMTLTMRVLYWLGGLRDKGLKWKKGKDGQMKLRHWRLGKVWYHPALLVWIIAYNIIFGIVDIVKAIRAGLTEDITISPVEE